MKRKSVENEKEGGGGKGGGQKKKGVLTEKVGHQSLCLSPLSAVPCWAPFPPPSPLWHPTTLDVHSWWGSAIPTLSVCWVMTQGWRVAQSTPPPPPPWALWGMVSPSGSGWVVGVVGQLGVRRKKFCMYVCKHNNNAHFNKFTPPPLLCTQ